MITLDSLADTIEIITFDCYGTLIDWNRGIRSALAGVLDACGASGRVSEADALAEYHRLEPERQSGPYRPYREVLDAVLVALADRFGFGLGDEQRTALSRSLGDWPPFADTVAALSRLRRRFRLGVLSNVDGDLFAETARQLGVRFDLLVTAEDVRSYKPAHAHFLRAQESIGTERSRWLHAAQSRYHDCVPCKALDIHCVWINRLGEPRRLDVEPIAEFPDLARFADALLP